MSKFYCKICNQELLFEGQSQMAYCYNVPQIDSLKRFHYYLINAPHKREYFWYPEQELNIGIDNYIQTRIYNSKFDFTIPYEMFAKLKFDPQNASLLMNKIKKYKLYL